MSAETPESSVYVLSVFVTWLLTAEWAASRNVNELPIRLLYAYKSDSIQNKEHKLAHTHFAENKYEMNDVNVDKNPLEQNANPSELAVQLCPIVWKANKIADKTIRSLTIIMTGERKKEKKKAKQKVSLIKKIKNK